MHNGTPEGITIVAFVVGALSMASTAAAQEGPMLEEGTSRVSAFGNFGFGGEADGEIRNTDDDEEVADIDDADMETTNGFGAQWSYGILKNVTVGGRATLNWFSTDSWADQDIDRSMLLNIDVVPRGRYPLSGVPLELHLAVPVGVTLNFPNDELDQDLDFGPIDVGEVEYATGVSWNLSVLGGATYWITSTFGAFVEGGFYHQKVSLPYEETVGDSTTDFVQTLSYNQASLIAGVRLTL